MGHQKHKQPRKTQIKLNFITIENFCAKHDTIKKVKRQPRKQKIILANHTFDTNLAENKITYTTQQQKDN